MSPHEVACELNELGRRLASVVRTNWPTPPRRSIEDRRRHIVELTDDGAQRLTDAESALADPLPELVTKRVKQLRTSTRGKRPSLGDRRSRYT